MQQKGEKGSFSAIRARLSLARIGGGLAGLAAALFLFAGASAKAAPPRPGRVAAASGAIPFVFVPIEDGNRIVELDSAGKVIWQTAVRDPDDVSVTPQGDLLVNEPDRASVVLISRETGKEIWRYGHDGRPGSGPGFLRLPDDAFRLADGSTLICDSGNHRIIRVGEKGRILWQYGHTGKRGSAPGFLEAPNDAVPLANGDILITTEYPARILEVSPAHAVVWSIEAARFGAESPPVRELSDAVPTAVPDRYLVAVYQKPGRILELDHSGRVDWSYGPKGGPGALDRPSAVMALADGRIVISDDGHDRVVMVDRAGHLLWSFGNRKSTPGVSDVKPVAPWPIVLGKKAPAKD